MKSSYFYAAMLIMAFVFILSKNSYSQEHGDNGIKCKCGLLWGKGCKSDNNGGFCAPPEATLCNNYAHNCSD